MVPGVTGRLLSADGAAFALLPVPDLVAVGDPGARSRFVVDVELLSPDRLVRYLARTVSSQFLVNLANAYVAAAHEQHPEQSVLTVQDETGGVAVSIVESTPFTVTLEIIVNPDLGAHVVEPDGLAFDVTRAALVTAAHELRDWLSLYSDGTEPA
jgi:hypothetical protein